MLRIISKNVNKEIDKLLKRNAFNSFGVQAKSVQKVITAIQEDGDAALIRFTRKFDGVVLKKKELRVDPVEIELAHSHTDKDILVTMRRAIKNITEYNIKQLPASWSIPGPNDSEVGLRYAPVESAGVYVPGGAAPYFSTVLMNVIPAKVVGVKRVVLVTPPQKDGTINNLILAAAYELGVQEIYKVGGAQAIAALALGTGSIKPVDKIVGPGNIYVTLAKQLVSGFVGIDKLAGPSDSVIIADDSVSPKIVAADLIVQAEHDALASSILITTSESLADLVNIELKNMVKGLSRAAVIKKSFAARGAIFIVPNLEEAVALSNKIAPEHLELLTQDPKGLFDKVENAGAVFLGPYSPEVLGDYYAGTNHVLPTGGTARFSSPLGVMDFVKATSFLKYTKEGLSAVAEDVQKLALLEGFDGHAGAIKARKE